MSAVLEPSPVEAAPLDVCGPVWIDPRRELFAPWAVAAMAAIVAAAYL